jgi:FixJ family two-component response regulator
LANSEVIYVIDDDPAARKGLSRLLGVAGHEVQAFLSGDEFLVVAKPDMTGSIILDA